MSRNYYSAQRLRAPGQNALRKAQWAPTPSNPTLMGIDILKKADDPALPPGFEGFSEPFGKKPNVGKPQTGKESNRGQRKPLPFTSAQKLKEISDMQSESSKREQHALNLARYSDSGPVEQMNEVERASAERTKAAKPKMQVAGRGSRKPKIDKRQTSFNFAETNRDKAMKGLMKAAEFKRPTPPQHNAGNLQSIKPAGLKQAVPGSSVQSKFLKPGSGTRPASKAPTDWSGAGRRSASSTASMRQDKATLKYNDTPGRQGGFETSFTFPGGKTPEKAPSAGIAPKKLPGTSGVTQGAAPKWHDIDVSDMKAMKAMMKALFQKAIEGQQEFAAKISSNDPAYASRTHDIHQQAAHHYVGSEMHGDPKIKQQHFGKYQSLVKQGANPQHGNIKQSVNDFRSSPKMFDRPHAATSITLPHQERATAQH